MSPLDPPAVIPDDVWSLILTELCYIVQTAELLNARLVCKRWSTLITSEHVAYHALVAANRHILLSNQGKYPRPSDLPISWWSCLLDQVRLDRTWITGTPLPKLDHAHFINTRWSKQVQDDPYSLLRHTRDNAKEDDVIPGFEAVILSHASADASDSGFLRFDWTCADIIDPSESQDGSNLESGVIAYLALRQVAEAGRFFLVHVVEYPSLKPLAEHIVCHEAIGSKKTNLNFPLNGPDGRPLAYVQQEPVEFVTVALCHVDARRKTYLLSFTDFNDHSVLVLRSFVGHRSHGDQGTLASFSYTGRCTSTIVRPSDIPDHYRVVVVDPATYHTHIHTLSADTLIPHSPSPAVLEDDTYLFDHFPHLHRSLTVIASSIGTISLWDSRSNTLLDWFPATPDARPVRVPFLRPIIRPHLLAEARAVRASTSDTPLHEQREWVQMLVGYVDTPLDFEELEPLRGCKMALVTLPREANTDARQLAADRPPPRRRSEERVGYLNTFLGPSFMAGEVLGHLVFVLQYDGSVVVVDLRDTGSVAGKRRKVFDMHRRAIEQWIGDRETPEICSATEHEGRYPLRTHVVTGEQVRGAPNELKLPEWAQKVVGGYNATLDQAASADASVAPLLHTLLSLPDEPADHVQDEDQELGDWMDQTAADDQQEWIDHGGEEAQVGGDGDDQAWMTDDDEDAADTQVAAPVPPTFPHYLDGDWMADQNTLDDVLLDDQLDAMLPSEEDINLSCAGDIMLLGQRGNAVLVHYGKYIAVLRRREPSG
ncbi:hypothetical protein BCR44DRAFT_43699 [Catenaria anguillulae PL171]|uniref:F-box domain-containing protein n=1 Tax=Catenaria anguillulae PL171 TaxID=765915 RepID=A0A1Y2I4C9_9FUNG|nr:hypothetical protein BCR44DRAFT_43699 [Catenaria anguillulae PL171]